MKICVLGMGYIGLPTALLLAEKNTVIGFDIDKNKIESIKQEKLYFNEKDLDKIFEKSKPNFIATSNIDDIKECDTYIIAVPSPITEDKKCDLAYVKNAAETVIKVINKGNLVILESTVSPGTTINVVKPILEKNGFECGKDFMLSYVSEKAIPGNTIHEMINNDRIIGAYDEKSGEKTKELYLGFVKGNIYITNCSTAEMVKIMENVYRDINIALANEFLKIAKDFKINIWEAIELTNKHPRVHVHLPGPGVGGHCVPIDPWFITNQETDLLNIARKINDSMPEYVCNLVKDVIKQRNVENPKIAILGAAYKKNVDDARTSPTKNIYEILTKDFEVKIHDPYVKNFKYPIESDINNILKECNIILLVTDHDVYKDLDYSNKIVIDTKNTLKNPTKLMGNER